MAEPIVTGFGLTTEAAITAPAPTQWATNLNGGGAQQSKTVKVTFFVSIKGSIEPVILRLTLNNFKAHPLYISSTWYN